MVQRLPWGFSLMASGEIQLADSILSSYNRFSYGGGRFGRGYGPVELEGDNGLAGALEARRTWHPGGRIALEPFAFVDYGRVWPSGGGAAGLSGSEERASAGFGLRLRGNVGPESLPDFSLSAWLGKPLEPDRQRRRPTRLFFQASLYF